jgi:hypothetical protein
VLIRLLDWLEALEEGVVDWQLGDTGINGVAKLFDVTGFEVRIGSDL